MIASAPVPGMWGPAFAGWGAAAAPPAARWTGSTATPALRAPEPASSAPASAGFPTGGSGRAFAGGPVPATGWEAPAELGWDPMMRPASELEPVPAGADPTNLIVNYLPKHIGEAELRQMFTPFGTLVQLKLIRDEQTGRSCGYGFVKFDNPMSAAMAIRALHGRQMGSKVLRVNVARPRNKKIAGVLVQVRNLPVHSSVQSIRGLFGQFGPFRDIRMVEEPGAVDRIGALVKFSSGPHAEEAIRIMNGFIIPATPDIVAVYEAERIPCPPYFALDCAAVASPPGPRGDAGPTSGGPPSSLLPGPALGPDASGAGPTGVPGMGGGYGASFLGARGVMGPAGPGSSYPGVGTMLPGGRGGPMLGAGGLPLGGSGVGGGGAGGGGSGGSGGGVGGSMPSVSSMSTGAGPGALASSFSPLLGGAAPGTLPSSEWPGASSARSHPGPLWFPGGGSGGVRGSGVARAPGGVGVGVGDEDETETDAFGGEQPYGDESDWGAGSIHDKEPWSAAFSSGGRIDSSGAAGRSARGLALSEFGERKVSLEATTTSLLTMSTSPLSTVSGGSGFFSSGGPTPPPTSASTATSASSSASSSSPPSATNTSTTSSTTVATAVLVTEPHKASPASTPDPHPSHAVGSTSKTPAPPSSAPTPSTYTLSVAPSGAPTTTTSTTTATTTTAATSSAMTSLWGTTDFLTAAARTAPEFLPASLRGGTAMSTSSLGSGGSAVTVGGGMTPGAEAYLSDLFGRSSLAGSDPSLAGLHGMWPAPGAAGYGAVDGATMASAPMAGFPGAMMGASGYGGVGGGGGGGGGRRTMGGPGGSWEMTPGYGAGEDGSGYGTSMYHGFRGHGGGYAADGTTGMTMMMGAPTSTSGFAASSSTSTSSATATAPTGIPSSAGFASGGPLRIALPPGGSTSGGLPMPGFAGVVTSPIVAGPGGVVGSAGPMGFGGSGPLPAPGVGGSSGAGSPTGSDGGRKPRLFVCNLPATCSEEAFFHLFEPFGRLTDAQLVRDYHTRMCKGYGFVTYETLESCERAIAALSGLKLGRQPLKVEFKQGLFWPADGTRPGGY